MALPCPYKFINPRQADFPVAAAEVAVGLALIVAIFRTKQSINIDELHQMEG